MNTFNRRSFLHRTGLATLGAAGSSGMLSQLQLLGQTSELDSAGDLGYKALVCIYLTGGNDSHNMLAPSGRSTKTARADYERNRGALALPSEKLHAIDVSKCQEAFAKHYGRSTEPLGTHPDAPELAKLYNSGDLAFLCNVGTLTYPVQSLSDLSTPTFKPVHLGSHSDQQAQWLAGFSGHTSSGWGGRMAELLNETYNPEESKVSMSISLGGINPFLQGAAGDVNQYIVNRIGLPTDLHGYGANYRHALERPDNFDSQTYKTDSTTAARLKALETIIRTSDHGLWESQLNIVGQRARRAEGKMTATIKKGGDSANFDEIFAEAKTELGDQLKTVAKIIAGRSNLGLKRQIFFCRVGNFDTHDAQAARHSELMQMVSKAVSAFKTALSAPGVDAWDKVVAFSGSDFGRTLSANSDDQESGTDHAWAGHSFIAGGAVKGKKLYGQFPPLRLPTEDGHWSVGRRGHLVPDVSVDQYSAVLAKWFGASDDSLEQLFPNLGRFDSPFSLGDPHNLAFL